VPPRPGEAVAPRDVGQGRPVELPDGRDHGGGLERAAVVEGEVPYRAALVELGGGDARAEAEVGAEPALLGHFVQVGEDLLPGREAAAPAARPERERVQVRRDVAGQARVGVVTPGPPEIAGPVEDEEVIDACLPERRGHADPPEPGADHHHAVGRMLGHGLSLALCAARAVELRVPGRSRAG